MIGTVLLALAGWLSFNVMVVACFFYPIVRDRYVDAVHRRPQPTI
jgi:hypothetical protein